MHFSSPPASPRRLTSKLAWAAATTMALAVLATVSLPAFASASADRSQEPGPRAVGLRALAQAPPVERLAKTLDLDTAQTQEIERLATDLRRSLAPIHERARALRTDLRAAIEKDDADPTEVGRIALDLRTHRESARASIEAFADEVEKILRPEQRDRFESLRERGRERGHERRDSLRERRVGRG